MNIGDEVIYKGARAKIVRGSYPRFGLQRVVIERQKDGRRFTVDLASLRPASEQDRIIQEAKAKAEQ